MGLSLRRTAYVKVTITRTTPVLGNPGTSGVFVQWHVDQPPATSLTFRVQKSGAPDGPFEDLVTDFTGYHWYDQLKPFEEGKEQQNRLAIQRDVFYTVTAQANGEVPTRAQMSIGDYLPRRQFLLRRKMHRDIRLGFKFNSVPFVLFKRKQWGTRCTACFDPVSKTTLRSHCGVCFGTSYEGGYEAPYGFAARKGVTNPQVSLAPQGTVEINHLELTMLDFPAVAVGDVIAEVRQSRRYVVKHVTRTELRGVPVHQKLVMSEIARDSVEYRLLVEPGMTPTYY